MGEIPGLHLFGDEPTEKETKPAEAQAQKSPPKDEGDSTDLVNDQRYLFFQIGDTILTTPLLETREVIETVEYKEIPGTTNYFLGIAKVRGEVLGIVDLGVMLGIESKEDTRKAIIVFDTEHGALGMKVDLINGVEEISNDIIEQNPHIKSKVPQEYLQGIAKVKDHLISVINLKKILTEDDMLTLRKQTA